MTCRGARLSWTHHTHPALCHGTAHIQSQCNHADGCVWAGVRGHAHAEAHTTTVTPALMRLDAAVCAEASGSAWVQHVRVSTEASPQCALACTWILSKAIGLTRMRMARAPMHMDVRWEKRATAATQEWGPDKEGQAWWRTASRTREQVAAPPLQSPEHKVLAKRSKISNGFIDKKKWHWSYHNINFKNTK